MTNTISKSAIEHARAFIAASARPLDKAYFDYVLRRGPIRETAAHTLDELIRFQTREGGFSCVIEPDMRSAAPSPIGTSVAFQYFRGIDAPTSLPSVKAGIEYLVRTVDRENWVWAAVDERVNEAPHAPWWAPDHPRFQYVALNPTAELLGYLYDHRHLVSDDIIAAVTRRVMSAVENTKLIGDVFDLHCCMRLLHTGALPASVRRPLEQKISASLRAVSGGNPQLFPMAMVPTPKSFGFEELRHEIDHEAQRLITSQAEDGSWRPSWDWSTVDAAAWSIAEREWRGVLTRQAVQGLIAYGYVAE